MKARTIVVVAAGIVVILAISAAALILQTRSGSHSTTSSSSSISISSSSTTAPPVFTVPIVASSLNNTCFENAYNPVIVIVSGILYGCSATLNGNQTLKQNMFRAYELYGPYSLSVNSTQPVLASVVENGATVFTGRGAAIFYKGNVSENAPMSVTLTNSETTSTSYKLTLDFLNVTTTT
jgi:hypothetical protein